MNRKAAIRKIVFIEAKINKKEMSLGFDEDWDIPESWKQELTKYYDVSDISKNPITDKERENAKTLTTWEKFLVWFGNLFVQNYKQKTNKIIIKGMIYDRTPKYRKNYDV